MIKDGKVEPYARWLVKRSRGLKMPFDLVKDEIYDRQAFEVMSRVLSPESCCVDIGCHKGQFLTEYMNCAPKGTHFAFEPIPYLYEQLPKTSSLPGFIIMHSVTNQGRQVSMSCRINRR